MFFDYGYGAGGSALRGVSKKRPNAACKVLKIRPACGKESIIAAATVARGNICGGKVWFAVQGRLF